MNIVVSVFQTLPNDKLELLTSDKHTDGMVNDEVRVSEFNFQRASLMDAYKVES